MHRSRAGQQSVTASDFIRLGEALTLTATRLFQTPCETRLIAYNTKTGDFTDTPRLSELTEEMFKGSQHVHLAIKPVSEKDAKGFYVTEHGNHMPPLARLQVLDGGAPQAEINGAKIDLRNLPTTRLPARPVTVSRTPAQPQGGPVA